MTQITQTGFAFRCFGSHPKHRREKTSVSSVAPWWVLGDGATGGARDWVRWASRPVDTNILRGYERDTHGINPDASVAAVAAPDAIEIEKDCRGDPVGRPGFRTEAVAQAARLWSDQAGLPIAPSSVFCPLALRLSTIRDLESTLQNLYNQGRTVRNPDQDPAPSKPGRYSCTLESAPS